MTVYALAQFTISDRDRYERYQSRFAAVFAGSGGRLLAADDSPEVIEGAWQGDKVVLLAFEDRAEFEKWARSDEYERIAQDRRAATTGSVLVLRGVPNSKTSFTAA